MDTTATGDFENSFVTGGYNHWTGLLDWTTGLTQTAKYNSFSAEE